MKTKGGGMRLGVVEEKVYYTLMGKHSQRLGHLGKPRVIMTLNHARGRGRREGNQVQQPGGQRYKSEAGIQNVWIT